jgi:hypothetical protein
VSLSSNRNRRPAKDAGAGLPTAAAGVVGGDFFTGCIDGLVRVNLEKLKKEKRQRYIGD